MQVIVRHRQKGKTTAALAWLRESEDRVLLVFNLVIASRLQHLHPDVADRIASFHEFLRKPDLARLYEEVGIDDAEMILQDIIKHPIDLITMTGELVVP
jgi:hypothetical protein